MRTAAVIATALMVGAGAYAYAAADNTPMSGNDVLSADQRAAVGGDGMVPGIYAPNRASRGPGMSMDDAITATLSTFGREVGIDQIAATKADAGAVDTSVPWLSIEVDAAALAAGGDVVATWKAALAHGAIADLVHSTEEATNAVVGGSSIIAKLPTGEEVPLDGGGGFTSTGQVFTAEADELTDDEIVARVRAAVAPFGLDTLKVDVLHPAGPAVSVVATVGSGDVTWTINDLLDAVSESATAYEGVLLQLVDSAGKALLTNGTAYRTGIGGLWFAEGQDTRLGAVHGGLPVTGTP